MVANGRLVARVADLRIVIEMGDERFDMKDLMLTEMLAVKAWSGGEYRSEQEFRDALGADDVEAVRLAYALAVWRKSGTKPRLDDLTDFSLSAKDVYLADEDGRKVEMTFETNKDGSLKLDKDRRPQPVLEEDGTPRMRYVDTGDLVPPTVTPSATSARTTRSRGSRSA
jgi:hypothetical protein